MGNNIFNKQDTVNIETINNLQEYNPFLMSNQKGILCIPAASLDSSRQHVVLPETYNFAKWIRKNRKDINIDVLPSKGVQHLRSSDFWMPIVLLASDVSLQVYLGLVTSYLYDVIRGALKHDKATVHVEAIYKDSKGTIKKFSYSGSVEGLGKTIKKIDINKFME